MTTHSGESRGRYVHVWALAAVAAVSAILAAATGGARAAFYERPTIAVTATPSVVQAGEPVTLAATISATSGYPDGTVTFSTLDATGQPGLPLDPSPVAVTPLSATTARATVTTSLQPGSYQVVGSFIPTDPTAFVGANTNTAPVLVVVNSSPPHDTTTKLAVDPGVIVPGDPETLTATVRVADASGLVPTGRVKFLDNGAGIGSATIVNGVATLQQVQGFGPGSHELTASYLGNAFDRTSESDPVFNPSSQTLVLTTPPALLPTTTHTTVTVSRSPITQGDRVTLVAHVVQDGGALLPAGDNVVKFMVDGTSLTIGSAQVDAHGDAVLADVGSWSVGTFTIVASYVGNSFAVPGLNPSNGRVELEVLPPGTGLASDLRYTGATTADFADEATLAADLRDPAGAALAGLPVTLTLGAQSCEAVTGDDGRAACEIVVGQAAGTYPVTATFAGSDPYLESTASALFTVTPEQATLTLTAPPTALSGTEVPLSATLLEDGMTPVAGRAIGLSLGGRSCTATTNGDGLARCAVTATGAGATPAAATFAGDAFYASAGTTASVTVQVPTTIAYTGSTTSDYHDATTLAARLTGAPAGAPVVLTVGAQSCTAAADASGLASCTFTPDGPAGSYPLTATYAGDAVYLPSSAAATFTVTREQVTLALAPREVALAGSSVPLAATLREDGVAPVAGRTVALSLGSSACAAVTDAAGVATCALPAPATTGPTQVAASFAGDDRYLDAGSTSSTLVYGLAPGGGSFVVGDRSATGQVTFWSAQWWKLNTLSSGPAPSSFKGFAVQPPTPACGSGWATDPGNSAPPPTAPLPAYMAVVVTGLTAKSGAAVSGDTARVVVVRTAAGYDASPGHDGTGTVVATVC